MLQHFNSLVYSMVADVTCVLTGTPKELYQVTNNSYKVDAVDEDQIHSHYTWLDLTRNYLNHCLLLRNQLNGSSETVHMILTLLDGDLCCCLEHVAKNIVAVASKAATVS